MRSMLHNKHQIPNGYTVENRQTLMQMERWVDMSSVQPNLLALQYFILRIRLFKLNGLR